MRLIQWRSQPKNLGGNLGAKNFYFRLATVFCLEYRFSKHKMTRYFKNLGGHGPLGPLATPMVSSVLFLHNNKIFRVLQGALRFLYLLVPVCKQRVQTKHTKSKTYNW